MVNAAATPAPDRAKPSPSGVRDDAASDRRQRLRADSVQPSVLGQTKLNPFGDLHTLQHLSARLARPMRGIFEPILRQELRTFAEPLEVQRFADYRAERPDRLTAWVPLAITPTGGTALLVVDGRFVLEMLDLFFGGTGSVSSEVAAEFSPAAETMVARLGTMLADALTSAWEPIARIAFAPGRVEASGATVSGVDGEDAMIVTRFGIARGTAKPVFVDILYPVAALKPHGTALTGKVVSKAAEPDAGWRNALTRAAMGVRFPVRSVLAEPVVPIATLMALKPGDVIPIHFTPDVPVMVGGDRLGAGTVGTSNGRAAIRITQIARTDEGSNT